MGAGTIDLEIAEHRIRILIEDPATAATARSLLEMYLIDEPAPLGFAIQLPADRSRLHVVVDRSGFVLGRARSSLECLSVLVSHLGALVPAAAATMRIRTRALMDADGRIVIAGLPLFLDPPPIERRLVRTGHRIIDRLVIDATADATVELSALPIEGNVLHPAPIGHVAAPIEGASIAAMLVGQLDRSTPGAARSIVSLAAAGAPERSRQERVDWAEAIVSRITRIGVPVDDRSAKYDSLTRR